MAQMAHSRLASITLFAFLVDTRAGIDRVLLLDCVAPLS